MKSPTEFSRLLHRAQAGDADANERVFTMVYDELRALARQIGPRGAAHTLQPTAIVHEAWLKLAPNLDEVNNRLHFFAVASMAMRQILADHARGARREKRGGAWNAVTLHEDMAQRGPLDADVCALDECLESLASLNARHARVVELRVFGGLTIAETALALGVSHTTVESDWSMARAWLWRNLAPAT